MYSTAEFEQRGFTQHCCVYIPLRKRSVIVQLPSKAQSIEAGNILSLHKAVCLLPFDSKSFVIPPAVQECKG
jgi:hypothetical protein